jgi:hypothetical protein
MDFFDMDKSCIQQRRRTDFTQLGQVQIGYKFKLVGQARIIF